MYIRFNRSHPMSYDGCSHLTEGWGLLILGFKYNTFGLGVFSLSSHFSSVVNNLKCRYSFSMYIYIYKICKYKIRAANDTQKNIRPGLFGQDPMSRQDRQTTAATRRTKIQIYSRVRCALCISTGGRGQHG